MPYVEEQNLDSNGNIKVLPITNPGTELPAGYIEQRDFDSEGNIKVLPVHSLSSGGGGGVETDPIYTADKPTLALKTETQTVATNLTTLSNNVVNSINGEKGVVTLNANEIPATRGALTTDVQAELNLLKSNTDADFDEIQNIKLSLNSYVTYTNLDSILTNQTIDNISDININEEVSSLMVYDPNIDGITNSFALVNEDTSFDKIDMTKSANQSFQPGTHVITFDNANVVGTIFTRSASSIKFLVNSTNVRMSASIKYDLIGVTKAFPATITFQALKSGTVVKEKIETWNEELNGLVANSGDIFGDFLANDTVQIRVIFTCTNPSATMRVLPASTFGGYKSGSAVNLIPFRAIQSYIEYGQKVTTATTLTTTDQTLLSINTTKAMKIFGSYFNWSLKCSRTGGNTTVGTMTVTFKFGATTIDTVTRTLYRDEITDIYIPNIGTYVLPANTNITVVAKYVGSGTVTVNEHNYSLRGEEV